MNAQLRRKNTGEAGNGGLYTSHPRRTPAVLLDRPAYASRADAIQREIVDPIEASGFSADEYDIEAIAEEALAFDDGFDPGLGTSAASRAGFRPALEGDEFWKLVSEHERQNT